jgi:hypothetical protein
MVVTLLLHTSIIILWHNHVVGKTRQINMIDTCIYDFWITLYLTSNRNGTEGTTAGAWSWPLIATYPCPYSSQQQSSSGRLLPSCQSAVGIGLLAVTNSARPSDMSCACLPAVCCVLQFDHNTYTPRVSTRSCLLQVCSTRVHVRIGDVINWLPWRYNRAPVSTDPVSAVHRDPK